MSIIPGIDKINKWLVIQRDLTCDVSDQFGNTGRETRLLFRQRNLAVPDERVDYYQVRFGMFSSNVPVVAGDRVTVTAMIDKTRVVLATFWVAAPSPCLERDLGFWLTLPRATPIAALAVSVNDAPLEASAEFCVCIDFCETSILKNSIGDRYRDRKP